MIKAFIIHLSKSTERVDQVDRLRKELSMPTEIVDAVDASNLSDADVQRVYKSSLHSPGYPFGLSIQEIACFLSHRKVWQAIIDQNLLAGLVLEDDVALTPDFARVFATVEQYITPNNFIRFPVRPKKEKGLELLVVDGVRILKAMPVGLGMHAQLIGQAAAKQLLAVTQMFDRPVDTTLQMNWVTTLSPLVVVPGGVAENSAQLGGSTIQRKRPFLEKIKREISRPIYRLRVLIYSRRAVGS